MRGTHVACAVVAISVITALSGCASDPPAPSAATASSPRLVAPVVKQLDELAGQMVTLPRNTTLDINTGTAPVSGWTVEMDPLGVAIFHDGSTRGGLVTNPGITPLKSGITIVTLTHPDTEPIRFKLTIIPTP